MNGWMNNWQILAMSLTMAAALNGWAAAPEMRETAGGVAWPAKLPGHRPFLACTPEELSRLRDAWKKGGPESLPIAAVIVRAEEALKTPLEFPPRGGQHNQWYQCDTCQLVLVTIDATHHRCAKCSKVYSGEPYDDVLFARTHLANMRRALDAAWAYAITQRAEFAADSKAVLLGYADRYRGYPYHDNQRGTNKSGGHLHEQTLTEASTMANNIAPAFDLLYDDAAMSKEEREKIKQGLIRPMLENIAKNPAGKSNWQSWHNAALFGGGALLGDEKMMRKTIDSPTDGFINQMRVSVSKEGMWYESSWGYHAYTLQALTQHAEFARRCGVDLWKFEPLRKMFVLPARYRMPDGSLPRFGDSAGAPIGARPENLESAYDATGDAALLPSLAGSPTFHSVKYGRDTTKKIETPALASQVFPDAGHAILRSSGDAGLAAVMTFGPYGGFHGHFDKLSFVLFGRGRELGVDPGRAASQAYRLPIHTNWYKATISHNAVLVDGRSQAPAEGKLLAFGSDGNYSVAVAECNRAYQGVRYRRLLAVGPVYALVIDVIDADKPAVFDWIYHNTGKEVEVPGAEPGDKVQPLNLLSGQEYIRWKLASKSGSAARVIFRDGDFQTVVTSSAVPGTTLLTGDGVGASTEDRVPLMLLRREGRQAVFAVAIEPRTGNETGQVTHIETQSQGDALKVKITLKQGDDELLLRADGTCDFKPVNGTALSAKAWIGK